ncbi:hypothetical protein B9Z55_004888 [Caenorhabditis nigoni]|uniref:Uncharacterized protein n=1 Tax=Caenorhabditis nigoni TaxID=1611254 RepID=A0A2G5UYI0_9PELO|nr:hypothetical protein B9Z55_004888 [Caenorhabditis nigoni]
MLHGDSFVFIPVIRHLLTAEVRMENLEFLDCSMTTVQEHELRTFVEHHPKLKTVVAISTSCENLSIPTINLLNFITATSTVKCLKYAIGNERCNLVRRCMDVIPEKLNIIHEQLNDSEITELLNALCYVLRESKDDRIKHRAINCLSKSNFFETERFFSSFSLEIPGIVELVFKTCDNFECIRFQHAARRSVFSVFNWILDFLRFGRTLQDRLLNFIMEKTIELSYRNSDQVSIQILMRANRFMSVDQYTAMCSNAKVIKGLFAIAHHLIRWKSSSYQRIIDIIVSYLKEASEETLKSLVSNGEIVKNCLEDIMVISHFPTKDAQEHLLHFLLVFSSVMSDDQLRKCYGGETVSRLMGVINTKGFRNPFEETRALLLCSILSFVLAKNLTNHRQLIKTRIREFKNNWGESSLLDCHEMSGKLLNALVTSRNSTDESICCCLILMFNFIYTEGYEADGLWNFMKTTSEGIRDNQNMAEYARKAAEAVLYEMGRIENK